MLVTRQIPSLFNGVSQQPSAVRSQSQWEAQVNATSSVVDGVRKRSPSEHLAVLTEDHLGTACFHTINRDVTERYIVLVTQDGIRVFDMDGNEKTVTAPLGWDYLLVPEGAQARFSYTLTTVADYTFVNNKTKVVEMLGVGADINPPADSYWWLNRPLNPAPSAMLGFIPDSDDEPAPYAGAGGTVISLATPTTVAANPAGVYKGEVQTIQDLPSTGYAAGDVYKVIGTNESNFQSFYVIRAANGWNETVLPGTANLIDATTMPHALIRQGDGTFVFGPFAWSPRRVGDTSTNPNPTFVGRNIRDIFFYRNRLGFCVDENVVLSRAGDFGNYYRLTVTDYLPDEVVDVAASETKVTKMEFAVPFQGSMMLFSDQTQFSLNHNEIFSGASVSLEVTTQYPMVPGVRPAQSGSDVYFASQGAGWGQLREYYVSSDNASHEAANVSAHVPQFIPRSIHSLVAAPEFDFVAALVDENPNRVYTYQFYWQSETEKVQSAWNYWEFSADATVLSAAVLSGYLYMVVDRPTGTCLERVALFYGSGIADLPFQIYLDRRAEVTGTYNAASDLTSFALPYPVPEADRANFRLVFGNAAVGAQGASRSGAELTWVSDTVLTIPKDRTAGPVAVGFPYETRLTFSRQYPKNARGEPIHTGRLQLKTFSIYHTDTAYFRLEVRPYGAGTEPFYSREFPMRKIGVDGLGTLGTPTFLDDKATLGIQANAAQAEISLVNDSHLGFCINAAEWEGFYFNRAQA